MMMHLKSRIGRGSNRAAAADIGDAVKAAAGTAEAVHCRLPARSGKTKIIVFDIN